MVTREINGISWRLLTDDDESRLFADRDVRNLKHYIRQHEKALNPSSVALLEDLWEKGFVLPAEHIPCHVVTLGTRMQIHEPQNGHVYSITLVYPHAADVEKGKISLFTAMGLALYGLKTRDELEFHSGSSIRRLEISKILYQPQAFGMVRAGG